jgi:hypothetical protein
MPTKLPVQARLVCPERLRSLSVIATDALARQRRFKLDNATGSLVTV